VTAGALLVLGVLTLTFVLVEAAPGTAADLLAAERPLPPEARARLEAAFGLDRPPLARYGTWIAGALRGDLGWSISRGRPVAQVVASALPATLLLAGLALAVQLGVGVALGTLHVVKPGGTFDHVAGVVGLTVASIPTFWLGLMAVLALAYRIPIFPPSSSHSIGASEWPALARGIDALWHAALPATVLGVGAAAALARYVRAGLLRALGEGFVRAAKARGASPAVLVARSALPATLGPVVTLAGVSLPTLVSGSIVVEVVFGWPGMGRLAYDAVLARDVPVVLAAVLLATVLVVFGSLAADLGLAWADPRARASVTGNG
jgi:peptide/nickel transport system permease protein